MGGFKVAGRSTARQVKTDPEGPSGSQQGEGVAGDGAQLVLIPLAGHVAAQAGMAQGQVEVLQPAVLDAVVDPQIPLPLMISAGHGGLDVIAAQVGGAGLQARNAGVGEVIGIACQPGLLAGPLELGDLRVSDQVGSGAITVVDEGEMAVAAQVLVAEPQAVPAQAVGEQGAEGSVVDPAVVLEAGSAVACLAVIVGAVGIAVEGAQIGIQLAIAQADVMDQSEEVLAVVVFQLGKVVAGDQVVGQLVVTAGKTELIDPLGTAGNGQPFVIGRGATAGPLDLAQIQGQALDVPGGQLTATECLRQQAAVDRKSTRLNSSHVRNSYAV